MRAVTFERAAEFGGAMIEIAFEGGAVEFGKIGHEGKGAIALQPAEFCV